MDYSVGMELDFNLVPILVEWHDAHVGLSTWEERSELEDDGPCVVHSCGFLLPTTMGGKDNHVSLVATWSNDDMVHSVFHIPRQMVQRITMLKGSYELADVAVLPQEQSGPIGASGN
jgi:hypothetical protein